MMGNMRLLIAAVLVLATICNGNIFKSQLSAVKKSPPACLPNYRACDDGTCVNSGYFCDSWVDCSRGEDDLGCGSCTNDEFMCSDESCISSDKICNGVPDCPNDDSDERGCSYYNCRDRYKCQENTCIGFDLICDGKIDCPNGSEERGCTGCPDGHFRCGGGECIRFSAVCDQGYYKDCPDLSDEIGCAVNNPAAQKRMSELESLKRKKAPPVSEKMNEDVHEKRIKEKIDERKEQQKTNVMEELKALDKELKERIYN